MDALRYPIGIQSFEKLRKGQYVYADKTAEIYRMTRHENALFLSRPRRFGKSLMLSTLEAYFLGRRDLFDGLAIAELEKEWIEYPVLRFDFSAAEAGTAETLSAYILEVMKGMANRYGVSLRNDKLHIGSILGFLIEDIVNKCGRKVVILVDEYDKGILDVLDNEKNLHANQELLRPFFSQIKAHDEHIRFSMITGVARFKHYTIFSGFNNLQDLSLNPEYASVCGLTLTELKETFRQGVSDLSVALGLDYSAMLETLEMRYDGYRFTAADIKVFNPFSILNCFGNLRLSNYWIQSGTSKVFTTYLAKSDFDITEINDIWIDEQEMEGTYSAENPIPLLFQTGYISVKDYHQGQYKLGIPNKEVWDSLVRELMPKYMGTPAAKQATVLRRLKGCIEVGDIDGFMSELQPLMASTPYHNFQVGNIEKTYHLTIYMVFLLMGLDARSEICMAGGRINLLVTTPRFVYVMEFKLDTTPQDALSQIDHKQYSLPWKADGRTVYKIGVSFSSDTRNISGWSAVKD